VNDEHRLLVMIINEGKGRLASGQLVCTKVLLVLAKMKLEESQKLPVIILFEFFLGSIGNRC